MSELGEMPVTVTERENRGDGMGWGQGEIANWILRRWAEDGTSAGDRERGGDGASRNW